MGAVPTQGGSLEEGRRQATREPLLLCTSSASRFHQCLVTLQAHTTRWSAARSSANETSHHSIVLVRIKRPFGS